MVLKEKAVSRVYHKVLEEPRTHDGGCVLRQDAPLGLFTLAHAEEAVVVLVHRTG